MLLGDRFFPHLRRTFEWLVQHYGIHFASVADVACGTGTFVRYLRKCGVPTVCGVDRSPDMLRIAMAKNLDTDIRFICQDFATLELPQLVDLITCNFDSLNYLLTHEDLLRALRRFHANLKLGGHIIFDMITNHPLWPDVRPYAERMVWPSVTFERTIWRNSRTQIQTSLVSILHNGRLRREIHVQRGYPIAMVAGLLVQVGFSLLGVHDFHTLCPPVAQAQRVSYVAQKTQVA